MNKTYQCKAIETRYNGYRFRSRTEARWAVFLDALGVPYEYEKEGYDLGDAGWYLPDFWLPEQECWLEIKGNKITDGELQKAIALASHTKCIVMVFFKCAPFECTFSGDDILLRNGGKYVAPGGDHDGIMEFGVCGKCDEVCIGHLGGHQIFCRPKAYDYHRKCSGDSKKYRHPRIKRAFAAARSARFEYGEMG